MADTKITALTALTAADPANDVLPIVDVSDTTMAASGTTKKISVNNILGASGTATLASATISGALTVGSSARFQSAGTNWMEFGINVLTSNQATGASIRSVVSSAGNPTYSWTGDSDTGLFNDSANSIGFAIGGSEGMRLNSTGLGVGVTPASGDGSGVFKAAGTGSLTANSRVGLDVRELVSGNQAGIILGAMTTENTAVIGSRTASGNIAFQTFNGSSWGERMRIDYLGNVGIGVTPSAWTSRAIQIGSGGSGVSTVNGTEIVSNAYYSSGTWNRILTATASWYSAEQSGAHKWYNAGSGSAGTAITWTQAMTLESTGSLVLGAAAVATTATDGFLYIPGCAGTPTGTPTAKTGRVPLVVDTTNNKLYFYSGGAWVAAN